MLIILAKLTTGVLLVFVGAIMMNRVTVLGKNRCVLDLVDVRMPTTILLPQRLVRLPPFQLPVYLRVL